MADILILAAGLGTRMKSRRAKVLHELGGSPLIAHVVRSAYALSPGSVFVVVGHQHEQVEAAIRSQFDKLKSESPGSLPKLFFALQSEQRGTGHAVMAAASQFSASSGPLVVLAGDIPLIKTATLQNLIDHHERNNNATTILTVEMEDPTDYGRIVRDQSGGFERSVEQKDAGPEDLAIREVNVSIYCFEIKPLIAALDRLTTDNAQGEYYLPDVPGFIKAGGGRVGVLLHDNVDEVRGINTRVELAALEGELRQKKVRELMLSGVTFLDPATAYIHSEVRIGPDTTIHPQVIIEGDSTIGSGCTIHSWSRLKNVTIGDGVVIKNSTVIDDSLIREGATVGPFARLRMNADIGEKAGIGNFVEVKKSKVGRGTKASHLTYLGDATLGDRVNIGAGTVTCNYDGERKHETIIEDDVKIGSD